MKTALIGKQLGDYTLVRLLATGGMSRIYEGVDKRLDRRAAVKVLDLEADPNDAESLQVRFTREARALAKLEHPNIISIYQFGEQDGLFFIAMKLIEGSDLAQELKELKRQNTYIEPARGLLILDQVASALDTAHAAKIIHRDVKPSNILIDLHDRATLTDFGLVIQPSVDSTYGTAFGTPRYISPEQATDSSMAMPQSDIYSLGIIVYELLTGQTPFDGKSPMEIALSHINDAPPPLRSINALVPLEVERAVLKSLSKDPHRRFSTAGEFISAVRKAYRDAGIVPDDTTGLPRTQALPNVSAALRASQEQKRAANSQRALRPVLLAGILLFVVVVIAIIALSLRQIGGEDTPGSTNAGTADSINTAVSVLFDDAATGTAFSLAPLPVPTLWLDTVEAIRLVYDEASLTIINTSSAEVDVRQLELIRTAEQTFDGERVPRGVLSAGACFRIRLQDRQANLPAACNRLEAEIGVRDLDALFWRATGLDGDAFALRIGDQVVAMCPAVPRGETRECQAVVMRAEETESP